jgi:hypothetical protein
MDVQLQRVGLLFDGHGQQRCRREHHHPGIHDGADSPLGADESPGRPPPGPERSGPAAELSP